MARSRKLEVVVAGDAKDLSRTFKKVDQDAGKLERRMGRVSGAFKIAGTAAVGALAVGLKQSVDAAIEAEKSQARLETQLKASGISYRNHASAIDEAIQKTSRLAGLDDEDLQDAFTNIIRVTGDVDKSLRLTGLAADFARAKHIDVAKAGEIVGKVAGGNTGVLGRYGIKIKEGATATEALGKLQQKFAGQAEAYGKTTAGAQDRFRVAVENLQEKIGEKLLPVLTKVADKAATFVDQMSRGTGAGGRFADKLKEIADRVRPIVKFFTDHPRLIAIAVGAWVTYRVAAAAALAITRLRLLGMFGGLGPRAAAGGAVAGRAFGTAASTSAAGRMRGFGWRGIGAAIGITLGVAIAAEVASRVGNAVADILDLAGGDPAADSDPAVKKARDAIKDPKIQKKLREFERKHPGLIDRFGATHSRAEINTLLALGYPGLIPGNPGVPSDYVPGKPYHRKGPRAPSRPQRPRPASGPGQNAPGGARARAASAGPVARAAGNSGIVALGRQLQREGYTVGEHPAFGGVAPVHVPNSYHYRGMAIDVNGGPGGEPGSLDALHARLVGRPGVVELLWRVTGHFDHLHVAVSGATNPLGGAAPATGGGEGVPASTVAPVVRRAPLPLTATLIGGAGGGSKAPPKRMGGRVPSDRVGGFWPTISREQIDVLSGDPKTNPKSRTARLFQLGTRRNRIIEALTTGQAKTQETRDRLLGELTSIDSEIADLTGATGGLENIPGYAAYLGSLDKEAALAELTPDTADDQDVARRLLKARQDALAYAQSHGFSDSDIAQAARDVKTAQDAVDSGDTATTALTDAIKDFSAQLKRQNDLHEQVAGITSGEAVRVLADIISGELGPRVALRALTPGNGRRADY